MSTTTEALEALGRIASGLYEDGILPNDAIDIATIRAALEECERLQAKLERVEGLAGEVAGDLEAELNDRYHGPDDVHPAMQRKYERDMEPIHELREALSGGEEGT